MTFQAKLTTKLDKFSVNDPIIQLSNTVEQSHLNNIVKNLLKQLGKATDSDIKDVSFDFLVGGKLLRLSVEKHLELYSDEIDPSEVLSERLVEVEYFRSLEPPQPHDELANDDWISCVDVNESYIISGSYDKSIRIFSITDKQNIFTLENAHEKPVQRVRWVRNQLGKSMNETYFLSSGHDEITTLRSFNTKTHRVDHILTFRGHNRSVNCLDVQDNLLATGSYDKTLRIWSLDQDEDSLDGGETKDSNSKRKKQKSKTSDKSIQKIDRSAIQTLTGHQESITGIRWLAACNEYSSLATCSMDRTIRVWDIEVGECKRKILSSKPFLGIDFQAGSNLILSASCDRHIRLWDARAPDNSTAKTAFTSHNAWVSSVAFGPLGSNNFVSSGYDNLVKLWDLRSSKASLYDLIGHHDKVLDVNWNNPGYIVSGSADTTLKIFAF